MGNSECAALAACSTSLQCNVETIPCFFESFRDSIYRLPNSRPTHTKQTSHMLHVLPAERFPKRLFQLDRTDCNTLCSPTRQRNTLKTNSKVRSISQEGSVVTQPQSGSSFIHLQHQEIMKIYSIWLQHVQLLETPSSSSRKTDTLT